MDVLKPRVLGFGAAAASALMLFAAGEPLGWAPLAWVALVPLLVVVLREQRWRWAWLYGLVFAFVYTGIELSWIFLFGWMAWTALTAEIALFTSVATLLSGVVRRVALAPLLVAGLFTGVELARDRWPVGGYPWGAVGTTQGSVPGVRWLAGTVGVYGLSFLAIFVSALIAQRIVSGRVDWAAVGVVAVVLGSFVGIDAVAYGSPPSGRRIVVGLVQGRVPRPALADQRAQILRSYAELTRRVGSRADVIVWPEDSVGVGAPEDAEQRIASLALQLGRPILFGRSVLDPEQRAFLNTVVQMKADGEVDDVYIKRHPVPFGEYVPFPSWRRFISTLNAEIPFDLKPGERPVVFNVGAVGKIATPICFESVFPRDFLDFARAGAEMYVLSTNNASFERSYASEQHLAHTRMRALETRQWVAQAALSGITAFLAPDGRVLGKLGLFATGVRVRQVELRRAHSLYATTGDLFPALWAGLSGAGVLFALVRRRSGATDRVGAA